MTVFVVDASLWVARLLPKDVFHQVVNQWMDVQRETGARFLAPAWLFSEIAGVVSRRTQSPDLAMSVVEQLQLLPELQFVEMDSRLTHLAANLAAKLGLRGADAYYSS
jgi:predicted nucleic acid-binding protein